MEIKQAVSIDVITVKEGCFEIDFTKDDVQELYNDVIFLRNAVLSLINPSVADKSDLPYSSEQYKDLLKNYFLKERELVYADDFLKSIFYGQ